MKQEQNVFGGQARWKLAAAKSKYMKYSREKWNPNSIFPSQKSLYKPPFLQISTSFTTENNRQRCFPQKTQSLEGSPVSAPHAPRNTTSYIIRSKNCGGIPTLLKTPSPSASASVCLNTPHYTEHVTEEWGVDSYGSMKGLLRVRHMNQQNIFNFGPKLDKCLEKFEQRLEQGLSRFKMVCPSNNEMGPQILETRINDQDNQIAYLEEERTNLRQRVHNMEKELDSLKLRMQVLEGANAFKSTESFSCKASIA